MLLKFNMSTNQHQATDFYSAFFFCCCTYRHCSQHSQRSRDRGALSSQPREKLQGRGARVQLGVHHRFSGRPLCQGAGRRLAPDQGQGWGSPVLGVWLMRHRGAANVSVTSLVWFLTAASLCNEQRVIHGAHMRWSFRGARVHIFRHCSKTKKKIEERNKQKNIFCAVSGRQTYNQRSFFYVDNGPKWSVVTKLVFFSSALHLPP